MLELCKNWYPQSILALIKTEPSGLLKKKVAGELWLWRLEKSR
jgi:hypothetical protein